MKLQLKDWTVGHKDDRDSQVSDSMPARVPGGVQLDYARRHGWGDYHYADNVRRFEALEEKYWLYGAAVSLPQDADGKDIFLVAKGIDYEFEIFLDKKRIWAQEGMFTPVEIDLTSGVKNNSLIEILIHPAPKRPAPHPHEELSSDPVCKPADSYGWDWHPHLLVLGIWDEFYLEIREKARIKSCELFYELAKDYSRALVRVSADTTTGGPVELTLYDREGNEAVRTTEQSFALENPRLWWCNGQGEPYLYTWKANLSGTDSTREGKLGFRDIRLSMNNDDWRSENGTRSFPPMTVTLNGRRIFAKGSNWVNPEVFPGTIGRDTYEPLLRLAKDANMNILRCWGGAIVNKESFFELCDEMGIMIWQEFPLACRNYVGTEQYLRILEQEAVSIVKRLRKHACHVLWCGGNELFNSWSYMTDQSLALRLLNKVCYEHDRFKPFIPTSPIMGVSHGSYLFRYPDGRDVFTAMQQKKNTAYAEFGVPSLAGADYLRTFIPQEEIWPLKPGGSYELHHAFNAWAYPDTWACTDILAHYFGKADTLEELVEQSNWLQTEGYKAIFEEARRQKPFCSMAINWCYNEPWKTAANNSIISYPDLPKPGYFAVKSSCRGLMASARIPKFQWKGGELFSMELWILNDSPESIEGLTVEASIEIAGEKKLLAVWNAGEVSANQNKKGPLVSHTMPKLDTDRMKIMATCRENSAYDSAYTLRYDRK